VTDLEQQDPQDLRWEGLAWSEWHQLDNAGAHAVPREAGIYRLTQVLAIHGLIVRRHQPDEEPWNRQAQRVRDPAACQIRSCSPAQLIYQAHVHRHHSWPEAVV